MIKSSVKRLTTIEELYDAFSDEVRDIYAESECEMVRIGQTELGTASILLGLVSIAHKHKGSLPRRIFHSLGLGRNIVRRYVKEYLGKGDGKVNKNLLITPRTRKLFQDSFIEAQRYNCRYVQCEHLILALTRLTEGTSSEILKRLEVSPEAIRQKTLVIIDEMAVASKVDESYTVLATYGTNVSGKALSGALEPIFGRDMELDRIFQILSRRRKNNALLVGEPGVGKTAIAQGIALRIACNAVPSNLQNKLVYSLDIGSLIAGADHRGQMEERLQEILRIMENERKYVFFIDDIHLLIGQGGDSESRADVTTLLKPVLSRGLVDCIGTTTFEASKKFSDKNPTLARLFQQVEILEPSHDTCMLILFGLRQTYEIYHKVSISDDAILAAIEYSSKFLKDSFLPDKALDLLDEGSAVLRYQNTQFSEESKLVQERLRVLNAERRKYLQKEDAMYLQPLVEKIAKLENHLRLLNIKQGRTIVQADNESKLVLDRSHIADLVTSLTGIPVGALTSDESEKLLKLEEYLHTQVIGQKSAVRAVAEAIRRARSGLKSLDQPIASFLFCGPTGVGKTELAKALATYFFNSADAMVRLDMSEYMERHTIAKLIGSPPGYVGYSDGGQLTDAVKRQPYTVVLFDEIEKAHPDVYNLMLQMFDEGRLTDSKGTLIDFQNTILIMTSNLGSDIIQQSLPVNPTLLGKGATREELATDVEARVKKLLLKKLSDGFRPEFLNRIDEILIFNSLTKTEALEVADLFLNTLSRQLLKQGYLLFVDGMAKKYLVEVGYDKIYGARPIRRTIKRLVEAPLSKVILAHNLKPGLYYRLYVETEFDNTSLKVTGITVTWAEPYQDNEIDNNNLGN